MRAVLVVAWLLMWSGTGSAQSALAAAQVSPTAVPPEATLVLRASPGARSLATRVARVLELRSGRTTTVGQPPPAGMLEALPFGQVGLDGDSETVRVLVVAADGRVATAQVRLAAAGRGPDPRAVALVVEALQDEARLPAAQPSGQASDTESTPFLESPELPATTVTALSPRARNWTLDDRDPPRQRQPEAPRKIAPLLFARMFTGVSSASTRPLAGIGAGVGLCAQRACALVSAEYPISSPTDQTMPDEVRYRYLTFASGFYTRPLDLGPFTPGASLAFVTRVGSVEGPSSLETDLGLRGTLEVAARLLESVEIMVEGGVDLALDQARSRQGYSVTYRGDTWTPWLLAAIRLRPELD